MALTRQGKKIMLFALGISLFCCFYYVDSNTKSKQEKNNPLWAASDDNKRIYDESASNFTYLDKKQSKNGNKITYPRFVNVLLTDQYPELAERFQMTIDKGLPAFAKEVVDIAKDLMDPPTFGHTLKLSNKVQHTPQSTVLIDYFNEIGLESGFFIECGAFDGERSSTTLYLEHFHGWSGLLIEADPYFYTQLIGKRRKSWSINACLSPSNHTQWAEFVESSIGGGKIINEIQNTYKGKHIKVPCFPLETLLLAVGSKKVDYFSLDVEGAEIPILKSIPFSRVTVDAWTIEYPKSDPDMLVEVMAGLGYEKKTEIGKFTGHMGLMGYARDFLFVRNDKYNILNT